MSNSQAEDETTQNETEGSKVSAEEIEANKGSENSSEEGSDMAAELEKQVQAAKDAQDRALRTQADFENYKRRTQKDQIERAKFVAESLIKEILPVVDNLDRAITHSKDSTDYSQMLEGVVMVQKQLLSVLEKVGVKTIEALHQNFDPFKHESVGQIEVEADSEVSDNEVMSEAQRGYTLHDRVIRPAMVMVSKKKSPPLKTTDTD